MEQDTIQIDREEAARRAGEFEGLASVVSWGIQTPEQHEKLMEALLDHARWLADSLIETAPACSPRR